MRRFPVILFVVAALGLLGSALPGHAIAARAGNTGYARAVCPTGGVRCMATVQTNSSGTPNFVQNPESGWMGPQNFHDAYKLPCAGANVPGGDVIGASCSPNCPTTLTKCKAPYYGPQIIAIVVPYNDVNIAADLNKFDSYFGTTPCPEGALSASYACLSIVNQYGGGKLPVNSGSRQAADGGSWAVETSVDVETAHAISPTSKILLVEGNSCPLDDPITCLNNLATAEQTAAGLGATEISNSWDTTEFSAPTSETSYDGYFNYSGIGVFFASGDNGYGVATSTCSPTGSPPPACTEYPASSPYVVAVGGTKLGCSSSSDTFPNCNNSKDANGNLVRGWTETVWNSSSGAGGSGCSGVEYAPSWQLSYIYDYWSIGCTSGGRAVADISADADGANSPGAFYDSTPFYLASCTSSGCPTYTGWFGGGGTSMATPLIAGAYALAGGTGLHHQTVEDLYSQYWIDTNGVQNEADPNLNDITSGFNGSCGGLLICTAGQGYDGPTGVGTPWGLGAL